MGKKRDRFISDYMHQIVCDDNDDWDNDSVFLFKRHEWELEWAQSVTLANYEYDKLHPKWRQAQCRNGVWVEVNQLGDVRHITSKELYKTYYPGSLYTIIHVRENNRDGVKYYIQSVHRLVAQAFCDNSDPGSKTQVNHIDGNKQNNWYKNLEWVTDAENKKHAVQTGLIRIGESAGNAKYTESQIRQVCQLLQDHPEMSFVNISNITGVRDGVVGLIYRGTNWKHISKDYHFGERQSAPRGESHGGSVYTESQIRHVCQLLQDCPDISVREISQLTGVKENKISAIYRGHIWAHVSRDYNFPIRSKRGKFSKDQIRQVCQIIQDHPNWSMNEIATYLNVPLDLVNRIHNKDSWTEISDEYDFSNHRIDRSGQNNPNRHYDKAVIEKICTSIDLEIQRTGKVNISAIASYLSLPRSLLSDIFNGRTWRGISQNYEFSKKWKR